MATESQDTEITLGTGKMLALFFGLVALCAVFFGMGFSLGKNSARTTTVGDLSPATASNSAVRPSAVKSGNNNPAPPSDLTFYKAVGQKDANTQLATNDAAGNAADTKASSDTPNPSDPMAAPPLTGYYVQVAAVSKQEDAEALVAALKQKQYPAFATNIPPDKLFHVQVGPFGDIKDAEVTRAKLVGDGYNPILKK
jgi:cell division septation protein DedD